MKSLLLTILLIISTLCVGSGSEIEERSVKELLRGIRKELPNGWTASYDKEYFCLEVSRDEPVLSYMDMPNSSPDEKPEWVQFIVGFRLMAAVSPLEYQRLATENIRIRTELHALYECLVKRRVGQKFDSFFSHNDEDKKLVAHYEARKKSLNRLPDFYFRNISLEWVHNPSPRNIVDDRTATGCEQVRCKVLKLLSKYNAGLP